MCPIHFILLTIYERAFALFANIIAYQQEYEHDVKDLVTATNAEIMPLVWPLLTNEETYYSLQETRAFLLQCVQFVCEQSEVKWQKQLEDVVACLHLVRSSAEQDDFNSIDEEIARVTSLISAI